MTDFRSLGKAGYALGGPNRGRIIDFDSPLCPDTGLEAAIRSLQPARLSYLAHAGAAANFRVPTQCGTVRNEAKSNCNPLTESIGGFRKSVLARTRRRVGGSEPGEGVAQSCHSSEVST